MRTTVCLLAGILLSAGVLFGGSARLAVSDLAVHSDNAQYKYVGKGLAEMIAVELRKSPDITLIEREKRTALLEEMEFSLSDLADSGRQVEVGRMLAAGYIVFGELIDMGTEVLLSLRMVDVQSNEIVWSEKLSAPLSRYDAIAGFFASAILQHFGAAVSRTTERKAAGGEEKRAEAVIALSAAIDLYDRGEKEQAKRQLTVARQYDPGSEATAYYLAKLVANTTRFKVLMEQYYSYLNPAFLGIMKQDMIHTAANTHLYPIITHHPVENVNYASFGSDSAIAEFDFNVRFGYAFPMGRNWGVRIDVLPTVGSLNRSWRGDYDYQMGGDDVPRTAAGAILDVGFRQGEALAFGFGAGIYAHSVSDVGPNAPYVDPDRALFSVNAGFLYRHPQGTIVFDSRLGYNNEAYDIIDAETLEITGQAGAPVFLENTLTFSLQEGATFLIFKQIDSVSLDRPYAFATLMPAVERFLAPWISLRAGLEGSVALLNDSVQAGYGALAGITFRNVRSGFDADLNLTWRKRPSRVVEGLLYTDLMALINLTWNGVRLARE